MVGLAASYHGSGKTVATYSVVALVDDLYVVNCHDMSFGQKQRLGIHFGLYSVPPSH